MKIALGPKAIILVAGLSIPATLVGHGIRQQLGSNRKQHEYSARAKLWSYYENRRNDLMLALKSDDARTASEALTWMSKSNTSAFLNDKPHVLQNAVQFGQVNVIKMLLDEGWIGSKEERLIALKSAVYYGRTTLVDFLLSQGAEINGQVPMDGGRTPLMCAVESRDISAVKLLLSRGADITLKQVDGKNAIEIAAHGMTLKEALRFGPDTSRFRMDWAASEEKRKEILALLLRRSHRSVKLIGS